MSNKKQKKSRFIVLNESDKHSGVYETLQEAKESSSGDYTIYEVVNRIDVTWELEYTETTI